MTWRFAMSNTGGRFRVEKAAHPVVFFVLYGTALQHYVAARVSLVEGLVDSGLLLSHQAIEAILKATWRLFPEHGKPLKKHHLVGLIKRLAAFVPAMNPFLEREGMREFLEHLSRAYDFHRYGESVAEISTGVVLPRVDEVMHDLREVYLRIIGAEDVRLYVPRSLHESFLRDNRYFTTGDISASVFAKYPLKLDASFEDFEWTGIKTSEGSRS